MSPNDYLEEVLEAVAPATSVLDAVRDRRDEVRRIAAKYGGTLRDYSSGSVMHNTAIGSGLDADCGIVLDRRTFPNLGPDGDGPSETVKDVRDFLRGEMSDDHPDIRFRVQDRAIKITYHETVDGSLVRTDDNDPTVDLIVAVTHPEKGLWIPKKIHRANTWDRSHPEFHNGLFDDASISLKARRQRTARLLKAWNKQYSSPGLSSFNLEVLVWEALESGQGLAASVLATLAHAASSLSERRTEDPAGVSGSLKLLQLKSTVLKRLRKARDNMRLAVDAWDSGDEVAVQAALSSLYWEYIDPPIEAKDRIAEQLRKTTVGMGFRDGRLTTVGAAGTTVLEKDPRSHGGPLL